MLRFGMGLRTSVPERGVNRGTESSNFAVLSRLILPLHHGASGLGGKHWDQIKPAESCLL